MVGRFAFTDKNVGSGNKTVTATGITVNDGNGGSNYNVSYVDNTTSTISAANLLITGITANNKIYDGTISATLNGTGTVIPLGTDVFTLGGTGTGVFGDKEVGTDKAITVSGFTLIGGGAGNYNLVQPTGLTADITGALVNASTPPQAVLNARAQLQSDFLSLPVSVQPGTVGWLTRFTPTQSYSSGTAAGAYTFAPPGNGEGGIVAINMGATGLVLNIVKGGVRLPDNIVNVDQ
jgi:hypothetical protein